MKKNSLPRRLFLRKSTLGAAGALLATKLKYFPAKVFSSGVNQPAVLGGAPAFSGKWPRWPIWKPETDEKLLLKVMRSGVWSRKKVVVEFEKKWAELIGTKRALATTNGTHALIVALRMLGVGPGDEVLTTPYTFIATIDAILMNNAMPVFVDVDPETFQIDPGKIEEKITSRTKAILPVHILGLPADMARIMDIARKHNLIVVEDACQAWLAQTNHQNVGTFGHAGCFSFQNSKNIPIGEGGAIVSDDEELMDRAFSFHNFGRPHGSMVGDVSGGYQIVGTKCRFSEYQAAIGLAQLSRLPEQTEHRNRMALYLRHQIKEIPGILPYQLYPQVNRAAYHLFPFRYQEEEFTGLSRRKFLKALRAEGVPCAGGYTPLNTMPYLKDALSSRAFRYIYPKEKLDFNRYLAVNKCPANDKLCREAVWLPQNLLLGSQKDMDRVAEAIGKISKNAAEINDKIN